MGVDSFLPFSFSPSLNFVFLTLYQKVTSCFAVSFGPVPAVLHGRPRWAWKTQSLMMGITFRAACIHMHNYIITCFPTYWKAVIHICHCNYCCDRVKEIWPTWFSQRNRYLSTVIALLIYIKELKKISNFLIQSRSQNMMIFLWIYAAYSLV